MENNNLLNDLKTIIEARKTKSVKELNSESAKELGCAHAKYTTSKCADVDNKKSCEGLPVCGYHYIDFNCRMYELHAKSKKSKISDIDMLSIPPWPDDNGTDW